MVDPPAGFDYVSEARSDPQCCRHMYVNIYFYIQVHVLTCIYELSFAQLNHVYTLILDLCLGQIHWACQMIDNS